MNEKYSAVPSASHLPALNFASIARASGVVRRGIARRREMHAVSRVILTFAQVLHSHRGYGCELLRKLNSFLIII